MRTKARLFTFVVSLAALAGLGAGCGENEVPIHPTYSRDIKPLLGARCIRCHGAGGTLNVDPDSVLAKNAPPNPPMPPEAPKLADFTRLDDANGHNGLLFYTGAVGAVALKLYLDNGPMPPPPAPPLTDREYEMLMRWAMNPDPN